MSERARVEVADRPGNDLPATRRPSAVLRAGTVVVRVLVVVLSLSVVAATGYGWWAFGGIDDHTVTTDVIEAHPGDSGGGSTDRLDTAIDILLVGMDSRTDAYGNPLPKEVLAMLNGGKSDGERNTDTMILVHIPAGGKKAVAFSFPRDSYVDIGPGYGKHKLNSAFLNAYLDARHDLQERGESGAKLETDAVVTGRKNLISVIEKLTGGAVTIDRYAEVNLASFYEVTKAVGGVEVCLKNAVNEPKSGANFPAGVQTISGAAALSFVRQRYDLPDGDLDRIIRQQTFLAALANKVLSADVLTDPMKARDLIAAVQKSVVLSSNWNLTRFAAQMQGLSGGNITFRTVPTTGLAKIAGQDVVTVDPAAVAAEIKTVIAQSDAGTDTGGSPVTTATTPPPSTSAESTGITVDVRNGTKTKGLAGVVLDHLADQGFDRGEAGDAAVQQTSVIRYAPGELAKAKAVGSALATTKLTYAEDRTLDYGHVRLTLGTTYPTSSTSSSSSPGTRALTTNGSSAPSTSTTVPPPNVDAGSLKCVD
ncbi:LCP family protein [Actinokineospora inagensis]|uniref:LCP family protein n=1 Tax=Actinokineospora inagensis TaxID=103730 RepID=UPI00042A0459|nr:LCP family protein [Actinokineospora inagensis]